MTRGAAASSAAAVAGGGPAAATMAAEAPSPLTMRIVVTLLVGVGAGVGGLVLSTVLHLVQQVAYGYGDGSIGDHTNFLDGVVEAGPVRRLIVVAACGVVAAVGWWVVDRSGRHRVEVAAAVLPGSAPMPVVPTIAHALLQVVTVALGSPLGREVAPREIGALWGGWLSSRLGLNAREQRVMLACGAGAGLAAVYNVPMGGALLTLEVLLATFAIDALIPAVVTSVIAALVGWSVLGNASQYIVPVFPVNASLIAWAIVAGPPIGIAAYGFRRAQVTMRAGARRVGWRRVVLCIVAFVLLGAAAVPLPEVLGNGREATQVGFDGAIDAAFAALVLFAKVVAVLIALRVGAHGGVLTPGLMIGALLAILLGTAWSTVWPGPATGAYALIGAAAFLAASMAMPLTAIVLVFEFTRVGHDFLFPVLSAVAGAVACTHHCTVAERRRRAAASRALPSRRTGA